MRTFVWGRKRNRGEERRDYIGWRVVATDLVEGESGVAWDGEVCVERNVLDFFLCFSVLDVVSMYLITSASVESAPAQLPWPERNGLPFLYKVHEIHFSHFSH